MVYGDATTLVVDSTVAYQALDSEVLPRYIVPQYPTDIKTGT